MDKSNTNSTSFERPVKITITQHRRCVGILPSSLAVAKVSLDSIYLLLAAVSAGRHCNENDTTVVDGLLTSGCNTLTSITGAFVGT